MSGNSITNMKLSVMDSEREDSELWESNVVEDVVNSDRRPTNSSDDDAEADSHTDTCADADIHDFCDTNVEMYSHLMEMPDYDEKLKVIHDRITRIVDRMSCLTQSLKQVHQGLKNYTNDSSKTNLIKGTELKKGGGDNGSTQTDPIVKPELNMLAERVGDSVGCQTIEDDPFE